MNAITKRPFIIEPHGAIEPCAACGARASSVCNVIPDTSLKRLSEASTTGHAAPGTTFITETEPATAFYNITGGTAKLYKLLPDGRRQIIGFAGAGHFLGLAAAGDYTFSAEAIDTVRYCRFSRPRLERLMDDFPAMETRLLTITSNELAAAQDQMLLLGRKTARERVASFLIAQSTLGVICQMPRERFMLPMTRGDIADYLGLTIETVSRTLTKLKGDGLIEIPDSTSIVIRNHPALADIASALR